METGLFMTVLLILILLAIIYHLLKNIILVLVILAIACMAMLSQDQIDQDKKLNDEVPTTLNKKPGEKENAGIIERDSQQYEYTLLVKRAD